MKETSSHITKKNQDLFDQKFFKRSLLLINELFPLKKLIFIKIDSVVLNSFLYVKFLGKAVKSKDIIIFPL